MLDYHLFQEFISPLVIINNHTLRVYIVPPQVH